MKSYQQIQFLFALFTVTFFMDTNIVFSQDIKTNISLKNEYTNQKEESYNLQDLSVSLSYNLFLIGVESRQIPQIDYFRSRPFLGLTNGSWAGYFGRSFDSKNKDYIFIGLWYSKLIWKTNIFLETKYFIGVEKELKNYIEALLRPTYPISKKWSIGIDSSYAKWNIKKYSFFLGPNLSYQINKSTKTRGRIVRNFDIQENEKKKTTKARLEIIFSF